MRSAEKALLDLALSRPPTLGAGRLVCLDGPAGSGKTTLAGRLGAAAAPVTTVSVLHMDDLYDGWGGLPRVADQLATILGPLSDGARGHYRRYDWDAGAYAEIHLVEPVGLLVLEGVGSGSLPWAGLATVLGWIEAPLELRLARGLERDGAAAEPHWRDWAVAEAAHFDEHDTRARADLRVDGVTGLLAG